jgi:hypothetical protein
MVNLTPRERAMKAQRGSIGIALLFLYLGARWGWVFNATARPPYHRERNTVPIVQEAWWASGPIWRGAEYFALTGIRSPGPFSP